mmetsp:Transcript_23211/g.57782  ORF Transcript_23211/g.57782 Transcript_23211/m.57782 type:complete len:588 (+) Transcript_23211:68-1831(+)
MASKKGEISQSVEESNKLRAKLGIKPLDTDGSKDSKKGTSSDPVHAPAGKKSDKPGESKSGATSKKTKDAHKELTSGEGLGDILAREEGTGGAADWVNRTRNKDGSMKSTGASKAETSGSRKRSAPESTGEIPRMKVRHDASQIQDGESITMTLSDRQLLDKDGNLIDGPDELSNVAMTDAERAKHNEALRKQVAYDPTKEGQDILEKYDELRTGPAGFVIGGRAVGGVIEETDPEKRLAILTALSEKHSLETKHKLQSDYYTTEEMAKFRKPPKKKAKRRKVERVEKDDAIGDPSNVAMGGRQQDAGSDEEDPELYEQLSKQRRLVKRSDAGAARKGEAALAAVSEKIQSIAEEDEEKKEEKEKAILGTKGKDAENIAMTATTEFCNVVQTPLEKMDTLKHESFRGSTLYKQQVAQRKGIAAGERKARRAGAAASSGVLEGGEALAGGEEDIKDLQEDDLDMSCASGLAYLRARSQIGNDQESHKYKKSDNRPLEMSTVDGDIKLEYRDDFGRVQTPKEAFRAISWKFHGKLPGRKNMERRLLRLENEMRLKTMDVMTSLPTLRALRHVQAADAKPYMVLSGANEK